MPEKNFSRHRVAALMQVCIRHWGQKKFWDITDDPENYINLLKEMTMNRNLTLPQCSFQGIKYPCEDLLTETITNLGVCYTFNSLDESDVFRDIV